MLSRIHRATVAFRVTSKINALLKMRYQHEAWVHVGPVSIWCRQLSTRFTIVQIMTTPHDLLMLLTALRAIEILVDDREIFVECTLDDSLPADLQVALINRGYKRVSGGFTRD